MDSYKWIFLTISIVFLILMIILIIIKLLLDKKRAAAAEIITLKEVNYTGWAGVWIFIKKHLFSFLIGLCLIMGVGSVILMFQ
ncbi:hypothetical protein SHELI_v1c00910 [Spiroplasma helicoides]|uniref:Uncharacterized protein n=1 Tax=Spiroplasma helicoides TaxID=216938 RepID=A0A1B3SJD6_9MOLU|nr:hypothetical protein [Spiroplasma helicoides]AOG60046.1 hypothetical protein SHELI_v1c00910 [Spiroplasma helicoides]